MCIYKPHVHNDFVYLVTQVIPLNVDLSYHVDEFEVTQLNIVIPLGYHPEAETDITYKPVLCSPTTYNSKVTIPVYSLGSPVQNTYSDQDNNFSNNANNINPQVTFDTPTKVLRWVKGKRVLNSFIPTPREPDFGQIFSDFEFHFRNLRLKHFFHGDPTSQVLPYTTSLLTPCPDSDSNSSLSAASYDESLAFKQPSFKNKSTFDLKHVQRGHLDSFLNKVRYDLAKQLI